MTELRRTGLYELHEELGARLIDFGGWEMPVRYTKATEEHASVRNDAGLFDLSHMAEIFVRGPQAGEALAAAFLLDATVMTPGRARYTMMCNEEGGIIDDVIIYCTDDDEYMVVANAGNGKRVYAELVQRCAGFDAEIDDQTEGFVLVAIQGPKACDVTVKALETIGAADVAASLKDLKYYRIDVFELYGKRAYGARTGYTGEDGFEIFVAAEFGPTLWNDLMAAGKDFDLVPVGLEARDTLRLEAGMPLYGNELSENVTPYDVGSGRLIKPRETPFVGDKALAKLKDEPHRYLIGIEISGRRPARAGNTVILDGKEIGSLTSGAISPTLDKKIGIASVDTELAPDTAVQIDIRGSVTDAKVVALPFYKRN